MIFGLKDRQTKKTLIDEFINMYFINYYTDPSEIDYEVRVVGADGNPHTSLFVGTGCRVQLVIEGTVYDEVQVVVKGDADGDGDIDESDTRCIFDYRKNVARLTGVYYLAADVASREAINESDAKYIANYRNNIATLYPEWEAASHIYSRDYSDRFANISVVPVP